MTDSPCARGSRWSRSRGGCLWGLGDDHDWRGRIRGGGTELRLQEGCPEQIDFAAPFGIKLRDLIHRKSPAFAVRSGRGPCVRQAVENRVAFCIDGSTVSGLRAPAAKSVVPAIAEFKIRQGFEVGQFLQLPRFSEAYGTDQFADLKPDSGRLFRGHVTLSLRQLQSLQQQLQGTNAITGFHTGPLATTAMSTSLEFAGNDKSAILQSSVGIGGRQQDVEVFRMTADGAFDQRIGFGQQSEIHKALDCLLQVFARLWSPRVLVQQFAVQLQGLLEIVLPQQLSGHDTLIVRRLYHGDC